MAPHFPFYASFSNHTTSSTGNALYVSDGRPAFFNTLQFVVPRFSVVVVHDLAFAPSFGRQTFKCSDYRGTLGAASRSWGHNTRSSRHTGSRCIRVVTTLVELLGPAAGSVLGKDYLKKAQRSGGCVRLFSTTYLTLFLIGLRQLLIKKRSRPHLGTQWLLAWCLPQHRSSFELVPHQGPLR